MSGLLYFISLIIFLTMFIFDLIMGSEAAVNQEKSLAMAYYTRSICFAILFILIILRASGVLI